MMQNGVNKIKDRVNNWMPRVGKLDDWSDQNSSDTHNVSDVGSNLKSIKSK